jgi:tetratricopeptide (TPR) repeat protein
MSTVYLCVDKRDGARVAVKILREEIGSKVVVDRFLREIAYSSELDHPRIPKVLGSGLTSGLPYYVMTYIAGESLRTRIDRDKQLPIADAIDIACGVIEPTSYAHERGIIHRDIKPENILLAADGIYVLDFGIARAIVESGVDRLTSTGVGVGTPAYMSPEQATGDRHVDARSDVYSIGCVLYEMLAGIPPFVGPTAQVIISRRFAAPPAHLSEFRDSVASSLDQTVARALARSPADRWPTAKSLADALRNPSTSESAATLLPVWSLQRRAVAAIAGIAVVGAIVAAMTFGRNRSADSATSSGLGRVVVAPLENRTGDRSLDVVGVMASDWITEGLQQTGLVQVVPTATALQASRFVATQSASGNQDPTKVLASETGAGTVVDGSFYRQGDQLMFRLDVSDQGGRRLTRTITNVVAPVSDPTRGVEELRNRLMGWLALKYDERLQGATPEGDQPPTYAAYQKFSEGMNWYIDNENARALPLFVQAFNVDSSFTVALLYASIAATNVVEWARADSLLKEVNERRQGLSEYNRAWLDYRLAFVRGDHERALAAIRSAAQRAPDSKAVYNYAIQAYYAGRYHEALTAIESLPSDRGPMRGFFGYWGSYCVILHALGLYDREYQVGLAAGRMYPDRLTKFSPLVRALIARGRLDSLQTIVSAARGLPSKQHGWDYGLFLNEIAEELIGHGHADSAATYFEQLRQWLISNDSGPVTRFRLVRTLYSLGRLNEAERLLHALRERDPGNAEYLGMTGLIAAKSGRKKLAAVVSDSLGMMRRPYEFGIRDLYLVRIAAVFGDRDEAMARLREAFADGLPRNLPLHRDLDLQVLRGYPPFDQVLRGKD